MVELKVAAMALYGYVYERPARKHFRGWHGWAGRSRLRPTIETARTRKRRRENILTCLRRRVTNAASGSITSKIHGVKYDLLPLRRPGYGTPCICVSRQPHDPNLQQGESRCHDEH